MTGAGDATVAVVAVLASLAALAAAGTGRARGTEGVRGNRTAGRREVTYDGRALILDGERRMLFSGDMHYPRSTPEKWPDLISKAKKGGLDVIQTYVFWNAHEPVQGQYNFEGRYDLVKFIREIHAQGLYVSLRLGPFVESEWKYGGLPFWLRGIPNITFRCDNEAFKRHMQKFVTKIVNLMKDERLFYPQGGPIIISQIENEYKLVEAAFHSKGPPYVHWAAAMAVNLQTGVPWMMCKQDDAPDPIYHGGTNFGRFASSYVTTSYYDGAPLDEYGLIWQPTWAHLRELHAAVKQSAEPLLWGAYSNHSFGQQQEINAQNGLRTAQVVQSINHVDRWKIFKEPIPTVPSKMSHVGKQLYEHLSTTKDETDYLWYLSAHSYKRNGNGQLVLNVEAHAHILHAFINNDYVGSVHGSHDKPGNIILKAPISLREGRNSISLLCVMVGSPVGLSGETNKIYTSEGSSHAEWSTIGKSMHLPLIWYKTTFDTPWGNDPVTLNLSSMGKGEVWINGESIGRYWVSFKTPSGHPSQSLSVFKLAYTVKQILSVQS
ncbi:beta-galactosidase 7-like isoform X2 [Panicum miliaceum]|uniref:beta-galactosidase n=1 Tax=Panicum miliaceum TaxID=4540 RepID=A0A3L6SRR5_PANMI|nr:beta-galactosidase 7-like isoform X2 [Panicum miliaceum]